MDNLFRFKIYRYTLHIGNASKFWPVSETVLLQQIPVWMVHWFKWKQINNIQIFCLLNFVNNILILPKLEVITALKYF